MTREQITYILDKERDILLTVDCDLAKGIGYVFINKKYIRTLPLSSLEEFIEKLKRKRLEGEMLG